MNLSSMVVSRDWQEVGVLECILGGLHVDVQVETEPSLALAKLAKSKIDALIVDCDLKGSDGFLKSFRSVAAFNSAPLLIVSGTSEKGLKKQGADFTFAKPISVEQAVHTLSAARNRVVEERLRYHRHTMEFPVALHCGPQKMRAKIFNVSQGGLGVVCAEPLPAKASVQVRFALPGRKREVELQGVVAWHDQQGHAGIRFVSAKENTKRDLQLWLEQQYFSH